MPGPQTLEGPWTRTRDDRREGAARAWPSAAALDVACPWRRRALATVSRPSLLVASSRRCRSPCTGLGASALPADQRRSGADPARSPHPHPPHGGRRPASAGRRPGLPSVRQTAWPESSAGARRCGSRRRRRWPRGDRRSRIRCCVCTSSPRRGELGFVAGRGSRRLAHRRAAIARRVRRPRLGRRVSALRARRPPPAGGSAPLVVGYATRERGAARGAPAARLLRRRARTARGRRQGVLRLPAGRRRSSSRRGSRRARPTCSCSSSPA